jgi:PEP-CTERM motif
MKETMYRMAITLTAIAGLAGGRAAVADTVISTFDNYNLGGTYAAWADTNVTSITSHPTSYEIESVGFGGGYAGLDPFPTDASGETEIQFDVTINAGDTPNVLALLEDSDGTQYLYRWFTLSPGNHVLKAPLMPVPSSGFNGESWDSFVGTAGTGGLNLGALQFLQLQLDPHGSNTPYDISYNDLRLTHPVPEPATLALFASGVLAIVSLRRRSQ